MSILRTILRTVDVRNELENHETIHQVIEQGVVFKGTNLWVLVFAIVIASVGLNTNSTAVIIGAMLISPLMGPINGIGYSIATYDGALFRRAMTNFGFAVLASLLTSTLYFSISPMSTAYSELLARMSPTIYDVLIALFGGLAGIVAISSKYKGNVLPGVAIATALMPPLCTAGYGLATAQMEFFFGAFYLFTINTVFIALAAVVVSQLLKFPIRTDVNPERKKRINQIISAVIVLTILPSIFFGYKLVQEERFVERATKFIHNVTLIEGNYLLKHEILANKNQIRLVYAASGLTSGNKDLIMRKARDFDLEDATILIERGFSLGKSPVKETEVLKNQIQSTMLSLSLAEHKLDSIQNQHRQGQRLLSELQALYPNIQGCSYAETVLYADTTSTAITQVIIALPRSKTLLAKEQINIKQWLAVRLQRPTVQLYIHQL